MYGSQLPLQCSRSCGEFDLIDLRRAAMSRYLEEAISLVRPFVGQALVYNLVVEVEGLCDVDDHSIWHHALEQEARRLLTLMLDKEIDECDLVRARQLEVDVVAVVVRLEPARLSCSAPVYYFFADRLQPTGLSLSP